MIDLVGWMLVHALWEGGLIAGVAAVLLWSTRRDAASTRYLIAIAGLAAMLFVPVATALIYNRPSSTISTTSVDARRLAAPSASVGVRVAPATPAARTLVSAPRTSTVDRVRARIDVALPWIVGAWLLGIALLSVRMIGGVVSVLRLGRRGVSAADARIRSIATVVSGRLGLRAVVRVLQSTEIDVPMVIGWIRPVVIVPVALLSSVAPSQIEMLLAHEIAHIRRYDTLVNLAATVVETLLFYHPAAWWLSARVREERENCCDDLALAACGNDRAAYGTMLLRLEESRNAFILAAAASDGSLLRRVRRIIVGPPTRVDLGPSWFAGIATMLMALLVIMPSRTPAAAAGVRAAALDSVALATVSSKAVLDTISTVRRTSPPSTPSIQQQPSRSAPMLRPSVLLAGAAALTIAAAPARAQAPNFSGRWQFVADSGSASLSWHDAPIDSLENRVFLLEQGTGTMTFSTTSDHDNARVTFGVTGSSSSTVVLGTPVSGSVTAKGVTLTLDATVSPPRVSGQWGTGHFDVGLPESVGTTMMSGSMTLSFDRNGDLLVQVDAPADATHPSKRSVARFKRA